MATIPSIWLGGPLIFAYLLLTLAGLAFGAILLRRGRSKWATVAGTGALLGVLAIVTGFSIGPYVAFVGLVVMAFAVLQLRDSTGRV